MKRDNMDILRRGGSIFTSGIAANEDPEGERVQYEDVEGMVEGVPLFCDKGECNCDNEPTRAKAEIRKLRHAVNGLMQTLRIAATSQGVNLEHESVECNCVEEATDREVMKDWPLAGLSWICPAHGYKRL